MLGNNRYTTLCVLELATATSGVARGDTQGAQTPPSALGLVNIVHRAALSSTSFATPNHQLLQKYSLEDNQKSIPNSVENLDSGSLATYRTRSL